MRLLLATTLLFAVSACHQKNSCQPGTRSKIEIRDGSGAMTLAWKGNDICNGQLRRVASVEHKAGTLTVIEPSGRLKLELTKEAANMATGRDQDGPHLRVYRGDTRELRVLRGDGVPYGNVLLEGQRDAVVYNPGSQPLAKVSLRDNDAVVTDMAGSALTYVRPSRDPSLAGVFGIPHLDPLEQLAIYIYWSK